MLRSWRLGSLFGIDIYVHSTFFLLPLLIVLSSTATGFGPILYLVTLVCAVFGCVLLHELGHALMARRYGIRTVDITLYPIGGVARLERMTDRPSEELWIALAGPAVNVVIAAVLAPLVFAGFVLGPMLQLGPEGSFAVEAWTHGVSFLFNLCAANVVLVLFNLLPMFPMDGGRVLRALLAMKMGLTRATAVAVSVGRVFIVVALALLLVFDRSILLKNPMLLLIAMFVFIVGQHELMAIRHREAARQGNVPVTPLGPLPPGLVPPGFAVEPDFSGFTWDERAGVGIQWHNGRPIGAFVYPAD